MIPIYIYIYIYMIWEVGLCLSCSADFPFSCGDSSADLLPVVAMHACVECEVPGVPQMVV